MSTSYFAKTVTILFLLSLFSSSVFSAEKTVSKTSFKGTIEKTSDYIKTAMQEHEIIGLSIALVSDDKIVWAEGFGFADKENKIPAKPESVYMLGSGSKTFTAVAMLQYLDKGVISLDEPLSKYIENFEMLKRFKNQSNGVTIRRLLNHHSGIPGDLYNNMGVAESWDKWGNNLYIDWLLSYLKSDYPSYAPGEIAIYCNTGFILAGEIIKKLSKEKDAAFNQTMAQNLLKPLNMNSSSFDMIKDNLAKGYISSKEIPPIQFNAMSGATGGLFTNVIDMSEFLIMLLNEGKSSGGKKILDPKTVSMLGESEIAPFDTNSYFVPGLGLDSVKDPVLAYAGRTWIKDGSTGNFNSIMALLPDKKLGVIILTNCDTGGLLKYPIMRQCLKNAMSEKFGLTPLTPKYPDDISLSDPAEIAGTYIYSSGYDVITKADGNDLLWKRDAVKDAKNVKKLIFNGKRYSVENSGMEIHFKKIEGRILMIQYGSDGSDVDKYMYDNYVIKTLSVKKDLHQAADTSEFSSREKMKISDEDILKLWRERIGKIYLINNISWNSLGWDDPLTFRIVEKEGVLFVEMGGGLQIVIPYDKDVAFAQGLDNRGDSSIRFLKDNNQEIISYASYTGCDLEKIPEISDGMPLREQRVNFPETVWYKYKTELSGKVVTFSIGDSSRQYKLRVFNENFKLVGDGDNCIDWTTEKGNCYLGVSPLPGKNESFTLKAFILK